ncbi:MAG: molecular chaperone DnaJ [Actinomycetes bacterium]
MSPRDFEKDYYAVLGVPKDADKAAIRKAYRKLARQYHPDANSGDAKSQASAEEKFKEISEAYDVLSDDNRRREYDEARTLFGNGFRGGPFRPGAAGAPAGGMHFDLGDLFGGGGGGLGDLLGGVFGGRRSGPRRGADVESDVTIDFVDAVRGLTVPVRLSSPQLCPTCHGNGAKPGTSPRTCPVCNGAGQVSTSQGAFAFAEPCRNCRGRGALIDDPCPTCGGSGQAVSDRKLSIRVPAGVDDGQRIRLAGRGEPGENGAPAGDLYVRVHVRPHAVFGRRENNLMLKLPVTFPEAALGATVAVPTLDGEPVTVRIPPGTTSGRTLRVKGKGIHPKNGRGGDLLVTVDVAVPNKLSGSARTALEAYRDAVAGSDEADPRAHLYAATGGN